jgi:hypothetical protein
MTTGNQSPIQRPHILVALSKVIGGYEGVERQSPLVPMLLCACACQRELLFLSAISITRTVTTKKTTQQNKRESSIKHWDDFNYESKIYSLNHLAKFEWEFCQKAKAGKPENHYKFIIEFGLHCFTRAPNKEKGEKLQDVDSALHYRDSRETRIFCFDRYSLSNRLPSIAKQVSSKPCFNTGKGNFFVIELINDKGVQEEYEIYFKVSIEKRGLLRLFVQSAYVRDNEHKSSQPAKKKIAFFVIANNIRLKKPIKMST